MVIVAFIRGCMIYVFHKLQQHVFQKKVKGWVNRDELNERGIINPNVIPKVNISIFSNPFSVNENLFKINKKFLPRYRLIRFSLDRPRRRFEIFLFHKVNPQGLT